MEYIFRFENETYCKIKSENPKKLPPTQAPTLPPDILLPTCKQSDLIYTLIFLHIAKI